MNCCVELLCFFYTPLMLLYSDQCLMVPNLSAIVEDFDFSDEVRSPYSYFVYSLAK